jgi:hypothetical protein
MLEVAEIVLQRNSGEAVNTAVNDALEPVLEFCKAMADYTRQTVQDGTLSSSVLENLTRLKTHMTVRIEEIMSDHPECFKDTSIHQLFGNFHDGKLPGIAELGGNRSFTQAISSVAQ